MTCRDLLLACTGIALLGGCQAQKSMPPVLTVSATECVAVPDLESAVQLTFDGKEKSMETLEIAASGPCLKDAQDRRRLFRLLRLPGGEAPYTVSVASLAHGSTVFAPHLTLLNADGDMVREIDPQSLMFRGGSLTGMFRPRADELYVLVASNPDAVGERFSRTVESMSASVMPVGSAFINVYSGHDTTTSYVFSHAGEVAVTVYPVPTPDKKQLR